MNPLKGLCLGSVAAFAVVSGASAADLPSRKAAPVEYVRVCSTYGAGFFYIPGTDSCLKIGGRVRAEYTVGERFGSGQDSYGTRALGRLNMDHRTATAYGTLRTYIRFDLQTRTGSYRYGTFNAGGLNFAPANQGRGVTGSDFGLDKGFIQFGPLTAGKAQSFFDFYAHDLSFSLVRTSDYSPNLLAYTATFGSGMSATVSLEDSASAGRELRARNATLGVPGVERTYSGMVMPDVVGRLSVEQGWGGAAVMGAVTKRDLGPVGGDDYGYAVQAGVKFNLPMIAAGDQLWLQAAYADGALGYLGYSETNQGIGRLGRLAVQDYTVDTISGRVNSAKGFSLVAGLRHYWMPTLRSDLVASYSEVKYGNLINANARLDPKEFIVAGNLVWSPVSGLDIGVEVLYTQVELKNRVQALGRPVGVTIRSDDSVAGRIRVQRDF